MTPVTPSGTILPAVAGLTLETAGPSHHNSFRSLLNHPRVLAYLSLALLAYQIAIIWSFGAFPTQDGPSHVYNAAILRELLFHRDSPYSRIYVLNHRIVPSLASPMVLSLASLAVGARHAEQSLATIVILALYGAIVYAQRALAPRPSLLWPGINALLNVWFLPMGFYNFYLGVALSVFCIGYYIKHLRHISAKHYAWVGLLIVLLYFTHPMAQALACVILSIVCVWDPLARSLQQTPRAPASALRSLARSCGSLLLSMTPGAALLLNFVLRQEHADHTPLALSWQEVGPRLFFFPIELFNARHTGYPLRFNYAVCTLVIFSIFAGIILCKRTDWRSPRGGIFASLAVLLGMYVVAPEWAVGGMFLKERLAWMILLLGVVAAGASLRSRTVLGAASLFLFPFVGAQLVVSTISIPPLNRALGIYRQIEPQVRPGSSILRLNYPADEFESRFGLNAIRYDPLVHAVDVVALHRQCLNWSNYEATSETFPAIFRSTEKENTSEWLNFEDRDAAKMGALRAFLMQVGGQLDYVIVYGELLEPSRFAEVDEDRRQVEVDFHDLLALLSRDYELIATAGDAPVLRLYRKKTAQ